MTAWHATSVCAESWHGQFWRLSMTWVCFFGYQKCVLLALGCFLGWLKQLHVGQLCHGALLQCKSLLRRSQRYRDREPVIISLDSWTHSQPWSLQWLFYSWHTSSLQTWSFRSWMVIICTLRCTMCRTGWWRRQRPHTLCWSWGCMGTRVSRQHLATSSNFNTWSFCQNVPIGSSSFGSIFCGSMCVLLALAACLSDSQLWPRAMIGLGVFGVESKLQLSWRPPCRPSSPCASCVGGFWHSLSFLSPSLQRLLRVREAMRLHCAKKICLS